MACTALRGSRPSYREDGSVAPGPSGQVVGDHPPDGPCADPVSSEPYAEPDAGQGVDHVDLHRGVGGLDQVGEAPPQQHAGGSEPGREGSFDVGVVGPEAVRFDNRVDERDDRQVLG